MKIYALAVLVTASTAMALSTFGAVITYDFNNNDFSASVSGGAIGATPMSFELANPAPGTNPQVQQLAERSDGVGGIAYYINQRSFNDSDTVSMAATESGVKFTLNPLTAGEYLNFSGATLSLDVSVYSDGASVMDSIGLYAIIGGATNSIGEVQTVTNPTGTTGSTLDMYNVGTTTRATGWGLTASTTSVIDQNVSFDLSSLGALATDQSVEFKVTGLVNKNNTSNFNSSFDNYVVDGVSVIPEPATLGLIAAMGGTLLFVRRRFMM